MANDIDTNEYASRADLNYTFGDEFFYPGDINYTTIEQMKERDETIASGLDIFVGSVLNMIGEYQHENEDIKNFIQEQFNLQNKSVRSPLQEVVTDMLSYGFGVSELNWDVEDMTVKLNMTRINPPAPFNLRFVADKDDVKAVRIWSTKAKKIDIPADKCLILRNGSGVYGESRLRRLYRLWKFKKEAFKWFAKGSEKYSTPLLVGQVRNPEAFTSEFSSGWNQAIIGVAQDDKVSALSPGSDMADSFIKTIDFLNNLIYRGLLVPQLLMSNSNSGAYALSKTHMEMFKSNVRDAAQGLTNDLIEQVITRMIDYQFGIQDDYGKLDIIDTPTTEDMNTLADIFQKLTNAGVVDPTEEFIRDKFKFPEADKDFLSTMREVNGNDSEQ